MQGHSDFWHIRGSGHSIHDIFLINKLIINGLKIDKKFFQKIIHMYSVFKIDLIL